MTIGRGLKAGGAALAVAAWIGVADAAASSLMERIEERAGLRTAIVNLIEGPDRGMAIAAFEEAMLENDPELRLSVMEAAFASDDMRLRKAAMRHFLDGRTELRVELLLPDRPDEAQQLLFDTYHGYRLFSVRVDPQTDIMSFDQRENAFWSGQLVEDGFDLTFRRTGAYSETFNCTVRMRPAAGLQLTGNLDCTINGRDLLRKSGGKTRGVVPLRIRMS